MKKVILAVGIVALFIGMAVIPAGANISFSPNSVVKTETADLFGGLEGPYLYKAIGWIKGYEADEDGITGWAVFTIYIIYKYYPLDAENPFLPMINVWHQDEHISIDYDHIEINRPALIGERFFKASGEIYVYRPD